MKLTAFLATTLLLGTVVTSTVSLPAFTSDRSQVFDRLGGALRDRMLMPIYSAIVYSTTLYIKNINR